jgi:hypothetical protein
MFKPGSDMNMRPDKIDTKIELLFFTILSPQL